MREIITVQVGQSGNQIGSQFWELLAYEHGLNPCGYFEGRSDLQLQKISVYFSEGSTKGTNSKTDMKYVPRAVMVDMEPSILDCILCCSHKDFFSPDFVISGTQGSSSNWAKGHLTDGVELVEATIEILRKVAENCEKLMGFQMIHSMGGGTGSGLGCLLTNRIKENFSDKIMCNFAVFPSAKTSDVVVEPYNATLSIKEMRYSSDITFILDNEALYDICTEALRVREPTYGDLNHLICAAMSGITCCLRFPGQLNADIRKLAVNMIPFPAHHWLVTSYAPLSTGTNGTSPSKTVSSIFAQLFNPKYLMASCDTTQGKYLATASVFRGIVSTEEVEEEMLGMQKKMGNNFVDWLPTNISSACCDIAPPGCCLCATFMGNSTAIRQVMSRLATKFSVMYDQKAFVHWYTEEGLDEGEFKDALDNINSLIADYDEFDKNLSQKA